MVLQIVLPLTRAERVIPMAQLIARLDTGEYRKRVLIILDNDCIGVNSVRLAFQERGLVVNVVETKHRPPFTHNLNERRRRIAEVWNDFVKPNLDQDSDLVLGIEDDSNFPIDAFKKLEHVYKVKASKCSVGMVSGIQVGRWGFRMIGAWRANRTPKPDILHTVPYREKGIYQVDATGLYFFLTRPNTIMITQFTYNFFGPDVNFGLFLRRRGYCNFIDYSVVIPHVDGLNVFLPSEDCVVLKYKKQKDDTWKLDSGQQANGGQLAIHG